jgi:shikimate kinase
MQRAARPVRHIVLVGLMGAGKTTVGGELASRLGLPWHDSDAEIETATGLTVRQLRDRDGVEAMHGLEASHLLRALEDPHPSVISAAASVIDVEACRQALSGPNVAVMWLRATPAVLANRFPLDDHRPSFGTSPLAFLEEQAGRRDPLFRKLDPIVVDVDRIGPGEAVARAIEALDSIES